MKQTTYPTEFRYHTVFDADLGGGEEHGTLRLLEREEFNPDWPDYLDACEGCGKPAMWANTPDDPIAQGYSGHSWCTPCWFDLDDEVEL